MTYWQVLGTVSATLALIVGTLWICAEVTWGGDSDDDNGPFI